MLACPPLSGAPSPRWALPSEVVVEDLVVAVALELVAIMRIVLVLGREVLEVHRLA